jgi:hypothetical protein
VAKKPRTPDPPRKVQAPKARQKAATDGGGVALPGANVLIGVGLVAIAGLVVALFLVLSGGKASGSNVTAADVTKVRTAMAAAGCTFNGSPAEPSNQHMSDANQKVTYKTFPPASGVHNPTPATWGDYRLPSDPRQVVHNQEHGGIAVWYGQDISQADRAGLDAFYQKSPDAVIVTPIADTYPGVTYPKHAPLGSKIALTVWTTPAGKPDNGTVYVAVCPRYDAAAFAAFRDTFRGKGPERFPVSQMSPGT